MFQNAQELMDALDGHFGQEAEEDALDFAEETGLLAQWENEDAGAGNEEYTANFQAELLRLEQTIGRQLTETEINSLIDGLSAQELSEQVVPDLVAEAGPVLASFGNTEEGRQHLGASAAQRVFDEQGANGGPYGGDGLLESHDHAAIASGYLDHGGGGES